MNSILLVTRLILGYLGTISPPPINKYIAMFRGVKFNSLTTTWIGQGVILDNKCPHLINIGKNVTIANGAKIICHFQPPHGFEKYLYVYQEKPVSIGSTVYIGCGSIILPGCVIGDYVIIGAGSVVTKDIPSGSIAYGNPARHQVLKPH